MFAIGTINQVHYHNILLNPGPGQIVLADIKQIVFDVDHACLTVHMRNRTGNQIAEFDLRPITDVNVSISPTSCVFQIIAQ